MVLYIHFQWNDGNTQQIRTFNPTAHATYTANFIGKPDNANRNYISKQPLNNPLCFIGAIILNQMLPSTKYGKN